MNESPNIIFEFFKNRITFGDTSEHTPQRPTMEVAHVDSTSTLIEEIRDKFNPGSPAHKRYIESFYEYSHELTDIFTAKPGILLRWDHLMTQFNTNDLSTTEVNQSHLNQMNELLDEVYELASVPLRETISQHRLEMDHFPDTMAFLLFSFYFF